MIVNEEVKVLLSEKQIQNRIAEIAEQITQDYQCKSPICIGVLKGAFIFMADLVRKIDLPLRTDFLTVSSYGDMTKSSGIVRMISDLSKPVEDEDLIIIEDIVDTGRTLHYLIENLKTRSPKSIKTCALLHKPELKEVDVKIDYVGFTIPNHFVIGYGLDAAQKYRNLHYIGYFPNPKPKSA